MLRSRDRKRTGATLVETAYVLSALLLLTLGLVVVGMGVFRSQEVALLAREGARYASVRGGDYQSEKTGTAPTASDIKTYLTTNFAAVMNSSNLTVQVWFVDMSTGGTGTASSWDSSSKAPTTTLQSSDVVSNRVRVTVTYQWIPEAFLVGPINLSSTCETAILY